MIEAGKLTPEQATIGAIVVKPAIFPDLRAFLTGDDFDNPVDRVVFEAMDVLAQRGAPLDYVTIEDELKARGEHLRLVDGPSTYLLRLANEVPTGENVQHYAEIVARNSALRRLKRTCAELITAADNGAVVQYPEEAQRLILQAQRFVGEVARGRRRPGTDLVDVAPGVMSEFQARQDARASGGSKLVGVSTGITALDYLTGGLRKGTVNVIGARTSIGKTAYACQIALLAAVHLKIPALIFSLEMTPASLGERFFSRLARIDSNRLRTGDLDKADWDRLYEAGRQMTEQRGLVTISNTAALSGIVMEARAFRVAHPNQDVAVVVDYLQKVRTGERGRSREQEVGEVSATLHETALDLECPFIVPAQLNRGPEHEEREPRISDLRESGAIENDADTVMLIARKRGDSSGICTIHLVKNRPGGATGEVDAFWNGPTYELRDPPDIGGN